MCFLNRLIIVVRLAVKVTHVLLQKSVFVTVGGTNLVDFVGRSLRRLFSEEVAVKFSLKGQRGNLNFSSTNAWKCLKGRLCTDGTYYGFIIVKLANNYYILKIRRCAFRGEF